MSRWLVKYRDGFRSDQYIGEVGQAAKRLFIWKRYEFPANKSDFSRRWRVRIKQEGRARSLKKAINAVHSAGEHYG